MVQTLQIEIQNNCQLKSLCLVQGVNIGINPRNLAQGLHKSSSVGFFRRQKSCFIRGLFCINTRWSPCDLQIITLYIITLEQMKIETCIMCQYKQDWNLITVYVHDNIKLLICINSRWPPYDLPLIITYQLNDGNASLVEPYRPN